MNCVYKIVCKDPTITEFYIGSTKDLNKRIISHKCNSNNLNSRVYCSPFYMFLNVNGSFNNWETIVLEEYKNINKKDLLLEEQNYIKLLKPQLNDYYAIGWDGKRKKIYNNVRNKKKVNCPICNETMNQGSLTRHKKRKH